MADWQIAHALLKYDAREEPFTTITTSTKGPYRLDSRDVKGDHTNKSENLLIEIWNNKRLQEDYPEIYNAQATDEIKGSLKHIEDNLDESVQRVVEDKVQTLEVTLSLLGAEVDGLKITVFENLTPEQKEQILGKYPLWEVGVSYEAGDIVNYENVLYVVVSDHTSQADWLPSEVASLYKLHLSDELEDGTEVISEWKQPTGEHDSYHTGDKVVFDGTIYESTIDNNTYLPTDYPQGWSKVEEQTA